MTIHDGEVVQGRCLFGDEGAAMFVRAVVCALAVLLGAALVGLVLKAVIRRIGWL